MSSMHNSIYLFIQSERHERGISILHVKRCNERAAGLAGRGGAGRAAAAAAGNVISINLIFDNCVCREALMEL